MHPQGASQRGFHSSNPILHSFDGGLGLTARFGVRRLDGAFPACGLTQAVVKRLVAQERIQATTRLSPKGI